MGYGYPPPPRCGQTNKVKVLPSRRTTYAGVKMTSFEPECIEHFIMVLFVCCFQYYENEFTLWDRFEVQGDITLKQFMDLFQVKTQIQQRTRKSSCVNARGIPTAAYQVLHMLSYPGGGGGGDRYLGVPPPPSGPGWGVGTFGYPLPCWDFRGG